MKRTNNSIKIKLNTSVSHFTKINKKRINMYVSLQNTSRKFQGIYIYFSLLNNSLGFFIT